MPSLATFHLRMQRRARQLQDSVEEAVKTAASVIDQSVVSATPVDTGRARANWQVGINEQVESSVLETDRTGDATIARNEEVIDTFRLEGGGSGAIYISNNVDYIEALNNGHSGQAPAGFVESGIQEALIELEKIRIFGDT